jgi:endonuclease YncB( thermonuclease family)
VKHDASLCCIEPGSANPRTPSRVGASPHPLPPPLAGRGAIALLALLFLTACGPQLGALERGEEGRVVRAFAGDTLELEDGTRVFLAEIDAPSGDAPYAAQSQGELEALTLHRDVLLAYGGERRWVGRPRDGEETPREAAIAHVFVKSEGGRWFWLQHELVARGAAYVRARPNNHARTAELMAAEMRARDAERGLWGERAYRPLSARAGAALALEANGSCLSGAAPFRIVEARVAEAQVLDRRAALRLDGAGEPPFSLVVFGDNFEAWDGPPLASLTGARVRARGPLGVYRDEPQLCLEHSSQLEVLTEQP